MAVKAKSSELQERASAATWLDVVVVLSKYGVGSVVAIWLVYSLTTSIQVDVRAVQKEARGIRAEHVQMGMYLQGICYGVNKTEERWRCRAADAFMPPEDVTAPLLHPFVAP